MTCSSASTYFCYLQQKGSSLSDYNLKSGERIDGDGCGLIGVSLLGFAEDEINDNLGSKKTMDCNFSVSFGQQTQGNSFLESG